LAIFWLPFSLPEQLKAVHDLLKIRFLNNDERKELEKIENELRLNIPLNMNQKGFLKTIIIKYGSFVQNQ